MFYIVGLGNPGTEYERTRHNVGFMAIEHFIDDVHLPSLHKSSAFNGLLSEGVFEGKEITILLPHTFVNASGGAVRKLVPPKEIENLLVVYDDVDLPLGEIKISFGRGGGGHNGLDSIIQSLDTKEFTRVRIGIGQKSFWTGKIKRPKGEALAAYVLGTFSSKEEKELEAVFNLIPKLVALFVTSGKEKLMNTFN